MDYCTSCLSYNRRLKPLQGLQEVITIAKLLNLNLNMSEDSICWECAARFCQIGRFRKQVLHAQKMLKMSYRNETDDKLKPLSTLCINKKNFYDKLYSATTEDVVCGENLQEHNYDTEYVEDWQGLEHDENEEIEGEEKAVHLVEEFQDKNRNKINVNPGPVSDALSNNIKEKTSSDPGIETDPNENPDVINEESLDCKVTSDYKLSGEQNFTVTRMSLKEIYKLRDLEKNQPRYKRCPYRCSNCIIGYYDEAKYERHLRDKHETEPGKKRNKCTICDVLFTRRDALKLHYERHFRRYQCKECPFANHRLASMLAHKASEHPTVLYSCVVCDEVFRTPRSLRYHKDSHREKPKCEICGKTAINKSNLKVHMQVHRDINDVKLVECGVCSARVRPTSLSAHRRRHAPRPEAAYCVECGVQFAGVLQYRSHLANSRRHASPAQRKFPCAQCDYRFTDKCALARHVAAKHLKVYAFKCHICDKGFIRKDRVEKHIRQRHEGISQPRDKICMYCGKGFNSKPSLSAHVRTHTGERPYPCPRCPAAFAQPSTRKQHVRALHHGEAAPSDVHQV